MNLDDYTPIIQSTALESSQGYCWMIGIREHIEAGCQYPNSYLVCQELCINKTEEIVIPIAIHDSIESALGSLNDLITFHPDAFGVEMYMVTTDEPIDTLPFNLPTVLEYHRYKSGIFTGANPTSHHYCTFTPAQFGSETKYKFTVYNIDPYSRDDHAIHIFYANNLEYAIAYFTAFLRFCNISPEMKEITIYNTDIGDIDRIIRLNDVHQSRGSDTLF